MPVTKFAISVPEETMSQVDRAAKRLGMTRSRYISVVLAHVAKVEKDRAISKKVDDALASIGEQDLATAAHLRASGRDEGTQW